MCSIAEFSSIWPTAGGQQYYTQALATGKMRPFLSYVVGWAVLFGEISMGSSCSLNSASIIRSFVEVTHPDYVWPSYMTWLVYSIFLIAPYLQNYFPRQLPAMNVLGAVWTVGGGLAWAASFLALAPKQNADFVFKLFLNNSGYGSNGWVFIMSLYTPIFGLYGTDGLLHLLEETKNPSYVAPVSYLTNPNRSLLILITASGRLVNDILQPNLLGQRASHPLLRRRLGSLHVRQPAIHELVHGHPRQHMGRRHVLRRRNNGHQLPSDSRHKHRSLSTRVVHGSRRCTPLLIILLENQLQVRYSAPCSDRCFGYRSSAWSYCAW